MPSLGGTWAEANGTDKRMAIHGRLTEGAPTPEMACWDGSVDSLSVVGAGCGFPRPGPEADGQRVCCYPLPAALGAAD
jgi:hypothetical protein